MSKLAEASRPATTVMRISPWSGTTMGRFDSVCDAIGTMTQPPMPGCRMGPPADSAYAVLPVGEATMRPSARMLATKSSPMSMRSSTMLDVAPRLTTTSFIDRPSKIFSSSRQTPPSIIVRCSSS